MRNTAHHLYADRDINAVREYMAEGSNVDDIGDYRPGLRAAAELSVKSPLREAVYDKFREIGFLYVTLDMKGYKSGSMNATLK